MTTRRSFLIGAVAALVASRVPKVDPPPEPDPVAQAYEDYNASTFFAPSVDPRYTEEVVATFHAPDRQRHFK